MNNEIKTDARFENLRLLDFRSNTCKARQRNRKTDLPIGVHLGDRGKPYKVTFSSNGVRKYLGRFNTVEEASQAYQNALKESQCQNQ